MTPSSRGAIQCNYDGVIHGVMQKKSDCNYYFLDKEGSCPGFIETTPRVLQRLQGIEQVQLATHHIPPATDKFQTYYSRGQNEQLNKSYQN
jgi:hypothetical protein